MSMGGQIEKGGIARQAGLVTASTGVPVFDRPSGLAALYRPHLLYHEFQRAGARVDGSFILFTLRGALSTTFSQLTEPAGYCHFRDPARIIGDSSRRLAELRFFRRPDFALFAQGAFLELLGILATARPAKSGLREAIAGEAVAENLVSAVTEYTRRHISAPIPVPDLAAHVRMSVSALAHSYPRLAGDTPLRTINRVKVERSKTLMLQEGLSVKETAYRLGFSSEFHFSRVFKRVEGLSPRHYLRALTAKRT